MKTLSIIALITATTAAVALAQPGTGFGPKGKDGPKGKGPQAERMIEQLDLTPEQAEQLREHREAAREEMMALQKALRDARQATQQLVRDPEASTDAIMKSVVTEGAAYLALSKARVERQLEVREIIGAEKAEQLADLREDRMEERRDRREDRRGGGPRDFE